MTQRGNAALGAIIGAIIVGSSAAFLASKTGQEFTDNSVDRLRDLKGRLDEFLNTVSDGSFTDDLSDKASEYSDRVQEFAMQVTEQIKDMATDENKQIVTSLLIGAVIGGLLGAGAASMVTSDSDRAQGVFQNIGSKASSVKHTVEDFLENLERKTPRSVSSAKRSTVNSLMDLVGAGVSIWDQYQRRR
jgi:gas vesicle protein